MTLRQFPARRIQRSTIALSASVLLATLALAACGGPSSTSTNPVGPGGMAAPGGPPAGMSGMGMGGGMAMGVAVANEFDFLTRMIPHHDEAIAAALVLRTGTRREEMRGFAVSIIETQTAEVEQMKAWLAAWYPGRDTRVSYRPMMRDLTGLSGSALDQAFLEDMIPHHMMAVMMSQQLVAGDLATHAALIPFATTIRDVQHNEIRMMSGWLRDWFGAARSMRR